jgi:hypothetical protein
MTGYFLLILKFIFELFDAFLSVIELDRALKKFLFLNFLELFGIFESF